MSKKLEKIVASIQDTKETGASLDVIALAGAVEATGEVLSTQEWSSLLSATLNDQGLLHVHTGLLESDNEAVQYKALELAYKLKGRLAEPPKTEVVLKLDF